MRRPSVAFLRAATRLRLRAKGYSKKQIQGKMKQFGDGAFIEWIKEYGPKILNILMAIIPIILALFGDEAPEEEPHPEFEDDDLLVGDAGDDDEEHDHLSFE